MNTIEMRLQKLEVTNRRYKTIVIVMLGAVLVTTFMAFRSPIAVPDVLQAKKFEVVDDNGNVLVRVSQDAGNGLLKTYNKDGKKLVSFPLVYFKFYYFYIGLLIKPRTKGKPIYKAWQITNYSN